MALFATGGYQNLFKFSGDCFHKVVSHEFLKGHLTYPKPISEGVASDMQVYNGAVYTNWGYGVPLLQVPFQALRFFITGKHFFPDRAIFFFYLILVNAFLLFAVKSWLLMNFSIKPEVGLVMAAALVFGIFTFGLYWLTAYRFKVYEETIAYLVLLQFVVLGAYLFSMSAQSIKWPIFAGIAAGLAVVVRGTGAVYFLIWGILFWFLRPKMKTVLLYAGAAVPFLIFWVLTNYFKTGSFFSPGYENSNPSYGNQFLSVRFGSPCVEALSGILTFSMQYLWALFFGTSFDSGNLKSCQYYFEGYFGAPLEGALIPSVVTGFLTLGLFWSFYKKLGRKEIIVSLMGIFLLAVGLGAHGFPFVIRYAADYWPFLILIMFLFLSFSFRFLLGIQILSVFVFIAACLNLWGPIRLYQNTLNVFDESKIERCVSEISSRSFSSPTHLSSRLQCESGRRPSLNSKLAAHGLGWGPKCEITQPVTNVYLALPETVENEFTLQFLVNGDLSGDLLVYFNNQRQWAQKKGDLYSTVFKLEKSLLSSPNIMVSIRWTRDFTVPKAVLESVRIL